MVSPSRAGLREEGFGRLSAHALRVGFITEACDKGVGGGDIMRHTRHRDLGTMRGAHAPWPKPVLI
jgi:hypothetical protein